MLRILPVQSKQDPELHQKILVTESTPAEVEQDPDLPRVPAPGARRCSFLPVAYLSLQGCYTGVHVYTYIIHVAVHASF